MKVEMHRMFEYLLRTTASEPEAVIGFSLAAPPHLGEYMEELDPELPLDWNNESFQGLPALRERVISSSGLQDHCTPDDVLITAGAAEANFLVLTQLLRPGDEIIIERPGWPQPWVLAEPLGATPVEVPRREDQGWQLDLGALADRISDRTRLIFITNPNNPTGNLMPEAKLLDVISLADKVGAYLLVDEVYAGLEWEAGRIPSVAGLYERGISTSSVSKTLGLQGLRTGWLICRQPEVVRDAMVLRENTSEIMNVLGEAIAEIALRPERYERSLRRARLDGRAHLEQLDEFIDGRPELSWHRPQAGLIGLGRLHLSIDGDDLAERLLAPPYRTFLIPGSAFGFPQHIRLGVGGGPAVDFEAGLERLGAFLDDIRAG